MVSVLIVDDHAIVRQGYVRLISSDPLLSVCGEAESAEEGYSLFNGSTPDVVITDPPRAGMHADVVKRLLEMEAEKIVYVSCNAATQARDIALMKDKYEVSRIRPVDMFPHTQHVENVVLLTLNLNQAKTIETAN